MSKSPSRRAILAGAITLPIAAAAPALAGGDDGELLPLGAEVKRAYDALGDAIDELSVAEEKLFEWRDRNPEPDQESAAAWIAWMQREVAFGRECGCDEAHAAEGVASDKLHASIDRLCQTPATSLRGLIVKARLGKIDPDALGRFLTPSILDDLLALAALDGGAGPA
jgi:hypothetical protein